MIWDYHKCFDIITFFIFIFFLYYFLCLRHEVTCTRRDLTYTRRHKIHNKREKMVRVGEALSVSTSSCSSFYDSEVEELQKMPLEPPKSKLKKRLSKQLSMLEIRRDNAWEHRRRQMLLNLEKQNEGGDEVNLTDEDLSELKGSIELGFGFNEEQGQQLTPTLPALDLYFAVTRQVSPVSTPGSGASSSSRPSPFGDGSSSFGSFISDSDSLKVMSPGDNPEQVKTRLRHWAQAVACSVIQSYNETEK